jgi:preprotein translocase subunit SecA
MNNFEKKSPQLDSKRQKLAQESRKNGIYDLYQNLPEIDVSKEILKSNLEKQKDKEQKLAYLKQETQRFQSELKTRLKTLAESKPNKEIPKAIIDSTVESYIQENLPDILAVVSESMTLQLEKTPYDVQLMAGIALSQNKIIEMATGEGKTLVAVLTAYINYISGKKTHIATSNDYLAQQGMSIAKEVLEPLGITVGAVIKEMNPETNKKEEMSLQKKKQVYQNDVVYSTIYGFGFDEIRDGLARDIKNYVGVNCNQRKLLIDEVDSILVDSAATPLIIFGEMESSENNQRNSLRKEAQSLVASLEKDADYEVDEKNQNVILTEEGQFKCFPEYSNESLIFQHYIINALKAKELFIKDRNYTINDGKICIVDQKTGRLLVNQTWSDGLHQAIEIKENLENITPETETIGSITVEQLVAKYHGIAGMSGSCKVLEIEFGKRYGKDEVFVIPTNLPNKRVNNELKLFRDKESKIKHLLQEVSDIHKIGRPILIVTENIQDAAQIQELIQKAQMECQLLDANSETLNTEDDIIQKAGQKGSITVATIIAGRGTDIILSQESKLLGGLHVIS